MAIAQGVALAATFFVITVFPYGHAPISRIVIVSVACGVAFGCVMSRVNRRPTLTLGRDAPTGRNHRMLAGIVLALCGVFATFMAVMFFILLPHTANPLPPFRNRTHTGLLVGGLVSSAVAVTFAVCSLLVFVNRSRDN